jgi:hypothetical protein
MTDIANELVNFYAEDPQLGDIVFLKNTFEDATIRGEVVGIERVTPHRGLNPDRTYEVVVYHGIMLKIAGIDEWLDPADWEITDKLTGWEYKKLPPEVVGQSHNHDEDNE